MSSSYDRELAECTLCLIADGYTLENIEKIEGMPTRAQFLSWRRKNQKLEQEYRVAMFQRVEKAYDRLNDHAMDLMDPEFKPKKGALQNVDLANKILTKTMGQATMILSNYNGVRNDDDVPGFEVRFVQSGEKKPDDAD